MNRTKWIAILILVAVFGLVLLLTNGALLVENNQGYAPDQPIAFSHKIHAGDNQINCLYCHYSAEQGRHAGLPAVSVCLNCHSNIKKESPEVQKIQKAMDQKEVLEWVRVHRLADFVYFNHQQHVVSGNVSCQTCHGQVEQMSKLKQQDNMTMGWCIDCHRASDVKLHESLEIKKVSEVGGTDCAKCHY